MRIARAFVRAAQGAAAVVWILVGLTVWFHGDGEIPMTRAAKVALRGGDCAPDGAYCICKVGYGCCPQQFTCASRADTNCPPDGDDGQSCGPVSVNASNAPQCLGQAGNGPSPNCFYTNTQVNKCYDKQQCKCKEVMQQGGYYFECNDDGAPDGTGQQNVGVTTCIGG